VLHYLRASLFSQILGISFYSPISQILLIPQQVFFSCYSPSDLPISSLIPRSISSVISSSFF
jgi:hypothetical protein